MRVLEIAGNRWRDQLVADLRKVMKLNRHNSLLKVGRVKESMLEHRAIMEAIAKRDPRAAVKRMQEHFRNGLDAAS
jgi:DNA-binding GntR family transcriptional regulator